MLLSGLCGSVTGHTPGPPGEGVDVREKETGLKRQQGGRKEDIKAQANERQQSSVVTQMRSRASLSKPSPG